MELNLVSMEDVEEPSIQMMFPFFGFVRQQSLKIKVIAFDYNI